MFLGKGLAPSCGMKLRGYESVLISHPLRDSSSGKGAAMRTNWEKSHPHDIFGATDRAVYKAILLREFLLVWNTIFPLLISWFISGILSICSEANWTDNRKQEPQTAKRVYGGSWGRCQHFPKAFYGKMKSFMAHLRAESLGGLDTRPVPHLDFYTLWNMP